MNIVDKVTQLVPTATDSTVKKAILNATTVLYTGSTVFICSDTHINYLATTNTRTNEFRVLYKTIYPLLSGKTLFTYTPELFSNHIVPLTEPNTYRVK